MTSTASSIAAPSAVPGVPALLSRRAAAGDIIVYVTNNSHWHRSDYLERLGAMGAPADLERVLTSARGTALALAHQVPAPRLTMVFGGPGLAREIADAGLATVPCSLEGLAQGPDAVAVGVDFELTHERLSVAADAVRAGAFFAATNRDPVFPMPGRLMAGAGAIVAALVEASGREPDLVIGKPEPGLLREAAALVGVPVEDAVVIGTGCAPTSWLPGASELEASSCSPGVSTAAMAAVVAPAEQPTFIAADAAELEAILDRLSA